MTIYGIIAFIIFIILFVHILGAGEAARNFIIFMIDIPVLDEYGRSPALYKLVVRLAYLITFIALMKLILKRRSDD